MNIAIVVNGGVNSGFEKQGIPSLQALIKALSKYHQITVYSLANGSDCADEFKLVNIVRIKGLDFLSLAYNFNKQHKKENFDLIQGFFGLNAGFFSVLLGKLFNLPSVVTLMGAESAKIKTIRFGALIKNHSKKRVFWMLKYASKIIALTKFQCIQLEENGHTNFDNFEIIPFGLNKEKTAPYNTMSSKYRLICVGNLNPVKDHFTLIKALVEIRKHLDAHCVIVGADYYKGQIQAFVREMKLTQHVEFLGQRTQDEVKIEMLKSDLLVISSLSEGQSLVFVEAMSLGLPTCSTNVGLMSDLRGSHCLTSPVRNEHLLAENIKAVLKEKGKREAIIQNGLKWTEDNSLKKMVEKYNKIYEII